VTSDLKPGHRTLPALASLVLWRQETRDKIMIGVYYILGLVQLFAALAIVTACDPVHRIALLVVVLVCLFLHSSLV
jgi:hypothetical protein